VRRIEGWRAQIDKIDAELVRLLNRRAGLAIQIGKLKHGAGLPVCSPKRERYVLSRAIQANQGPLDNQAIEKFFQLMIRESLRLQSIVIAPRSTLRLRTRKPASRKRTVVK
jgi:chorismate mutase